MFYQRISNPELCSTVVPSFTVKVKVCNLQQIIRPVLPVFLALKPQDKNLSYSVVCLLYWVTLLLSSADLDLQPRAGGMASGHLRENTRALYEVMT